MSKYNTHIGSLKRGPKTGLTGAERQFLRLYARNDNLTQAAKEAFPNLQNPVRKAYRLLEMEIAQELFKQQKAQFARQMDEEFKQDSRKYLRTLMQQAEGKESTKRVEKQTFHPSAGIVDLEERHYDKLAAISKIVNIVGLDKQEEEPVSVDEVFEVQLD